MDRSGNRQPKAGRKAGYSATQVTVKGTIEQLEDVDPDTLYDVAVNQVEKERALAVELGRKARTAR